MKDLKEEEILVVIGNKLRLLRKEKGYRSHEDFAADHGLPRIQYWRLEKGKANFTIKSFLRVLNIHELTLKEFFEMREKE